MEDRLQMFKVQRSSMKLLSNAGLEVVAPSENKDLSFSRLATLNTQT